MSLFSQFLLALGMSADAFAASVAKGSQIQKPSTKHIIHIGCIFGAIEMTTPLIGWALGRTAEPHIAAYDHWISFALLGGLGVKMIYENTFSHDKTDFRQPEIGNHSLNHQYVKTILTAFATSIDSMIVGVSLAFLDVNIWFTALLIGICTAIVSAMGLKLGHLCGEMVGKYANIMGGTLLLSMGTWILIEHLNH